MSHSGSGHSRASSDVSSRDSDHGSRHGSGHGSVKESSKQGSSAATSSGSSSRQEQKGSGKADQGSQQDGSRAETKSPGQSRHQRRYRSRGRNPRAEKKQAKHHSNVEKDRDAEAADQGCVETEAASLQKQPLGSMQAEKRVSKSQSPQNQQLQNQSPKSQSPQNQAPKRQSPQNQAPKRQQPQNQQPQHAQPGGERQSSSGDKPQLESHLTQDSTQRASRQQKAASGVSTQATTSNVSASSKQAPVSVKSEVVDQSTSGKQVPASVTPQANEAPTVASSDRGGQSASVEQPSLVAPTTSNNSSVPSIEVTEGRALSSPGNESVQAADVSEDVNYNIKEAVRMPRRYTLANALRMLAVDAVERAQSGHPGMPMGMADIAEVLWRDFLRHNPADPSWPDRDRFIVSNGHGSMLLYGLLYLSGYDLSLEDLKNFRQLRSKTPGHPEVGVTPGVETSTGPLGQGLANAVGMAVAEHQLAAHYNRPGYDIINHYTYVFAGDGCLMEGITHEACSLAGTLGLGKLIVFWDDNNISIDGPVSGWFTENIPKRFSAYGWQVITPVDGHQSADIRDAILEAQADRDRPTLICCKTQIGKGSPNGVGTAKIHGSPLGESEVAATREKLNWPHAPFEIPDDVKAAWSAKDRGARLQRFWSMQWEQYQQQHPEAGAQLERRWDRKLPGAWAAQQRTLLAETQKTKSALATRQASLRWLEESAKGLPELIGGAADVSGSVCTKWAQAKVMSKNDPDGNYIHYGVREFAMSAMLNGLALHGGFIPFAGTYLVFSDYARNAIRMAALMKQPSIFVYSHDSIAAGEDGPTHQPVEQLASLRLIPGLEVWRPADAAETMVAWRMAVEREQGPTSLIFTRQKVEHLARTDSQLEQIAKGGYIIYEPSERLKAIILSTGSEVQLAVAAAQALESMGYPTRVVSMPCCERFMQQDLAYQVEVMAPQVTRRISLECGVTDYWYQFIGAQGKALGVDRFGESAPGKDVLADFGLTVEQITQDLLQYLRQ